MLLARSRSVVAVSLISLAAILGVSISAYIVCLRSGAKGDAEDLLFVGLVASVLVVIALIIPLAESRKRHRELDLLLDILRNDGSINWERIDRFELFGEKIKAILREMSDSSDRKSARIAALSMLAKATMELMDRPVFVVGLDGKLFAMAAVLREDARFAGATEGVTQLSDIFPDVDLREVLQDADRSHAPVERSGPKLFVPIFSRGGEISLFLVVLSSGSSMEWIGKLRNGSLARGAREEKAQGGSTLRKWISSVIRALPKGSSAPRT